jgi:hypothetical protein
MEFFVANYKEPWNRMSLSLHPRLTEEIVESVVVFPWTWTAFIKAPNFSIPFLIKQRIRLDYFSFPCISEKATEEFFLENRDNPLWINYGMLSQNPRISLKFIRAHPDVPWCYRNLSSHPELTEEFVTERIDRNWDWKRLNMNPNISVQFLEKHNQLDYTFLSHNPALTADYVVQNKDKPWNWFNLASNKFLKDPRFHAKIQKLEKAIIPLQCRFLHRYYRPTSALFKDRMRRKITEIMENIE